MRDEMVAHFNGLIPSEDDLGRLLVGTFDNWSDRVKLLDDKHKQKYTDELQKQGVIEIEGVEAIPDEEIE